MNATHERTQFSVAKASLAARSSERRGLLVPPKPACGVLNDTGDCASSFADPRRPELQPSCEPKQFPQLLEPRRLWGSSDQSLPRHLAALAGWLRARRNHHHRQNHPRGGKSSRPPQSILDLGLCCTIKISTLSPPQRPPQRRR